MHSAQQNSVWPFLRRLALPLCAAPGRVLPLAAGSRQQAGQQRSGRAAGFRARPPGTGAVSSVHYHYFRRVSPPSIHGYQATPGTPAALAGPQGPRRAVRRSRARGRCLGRSRRWASAAAACRRPPRGAARGSRAAAPWRAPWTARRSPAVAGSAAPPPPAGPGPARTGGGASEVMRGLVGYRAPRPGGLRRGRRALLRGPGRARVPSRAPGLRGGRAGHGLLRPPGGLCSPSPAWRPALRAPRPVRVGHTAQSCSAQPH